MSRITDLIHGATLAEDSAPLCLNGSIQREYEDALREVDRLEAEAEQPRRGKRLGQGSGLTEARAALDEIAGRMAPYILRLKLRAVSDEEFNRLKALHPPRNEGGEPHKGDQLFGANSETFLPALLRASIVGAEEDDHVEAIDPADLDLLLSKKLSFGQRAALTDKAWNLNRRTVDIPFSHAASPETPSS
jgi:hypothetical protein